MLTTPDLKSTVLIHHKNYRFMICTAAAQYLWRFVKNDYSKYIFKCVCLKFVNLRTDLC